MQYQNLTTWFQNASKLTPLREKILLVVVVLFVGLFEVVGLMKPIASGLGSVSKTPLKVSQKVIEIMSSPYFMFKASHNAARRIQDLELRYAESQAKLTELEALKIENEALRGLLENTDRTTQPSLVTAPLVSLADPAVAVGIEDGVSAGQLVLVGKTLVGVVKTPGPSQSEVALLYQPDGPLLVARTESGVEGLVRGDGRRVLLTEIPLDQTINIGERVMTVGQVGVPAQVFIGQIQSVKKNPASATQVAVIDQLVSFFQSAVVEIQSL